MIRKLLIFILPLVGLIGGGAAGAMLRSPPAAGDAHAESTNSHGGEAEAASHGEASASHGEPAKSDAGHGADTGHGGGEVDKDALAWFRFPSQFFVPVIRNARPEAVMVITLTIETTKASEKSIFDKEHRLRDALLRQLMIHANTGGFDGNFTSDAHMTELRGKLLKAARDVGGPEVRDVLIEDLARQAQ